MAADLATINNTLLSIKRDTAITAKRLSGKGTSAEEAREGLKQRAVKRDAIAKPTAPKAPTRKSGGSGGGLGGLFGKVIDWVKWFGLAGLAVWFRKEIWAFLKAAFEPFKKKLDVWWDEKKDGIAKAWEGVLDATGFNTLMAGIDTLWGNTIKPFFDWFKPDNNKFIKWFKDAGISLDTWLDDSFLGDEWKGMKNFLFGTTEKGEYGDTTTGGLFGGVREYAGNLKTAIGKFGESLGLLDDKGEVTGLGMAAGVGALATLFTFIGPATLITSAFKGVFAIAGAGVKTVGTLMKWALTPFANVGLSMLSLAGDAVIWGGKAGAKVAGKGLAFGMNAAATGFLAIAGKVGETGALQRGLVTLGAWFESKGVTLKEASRFGKTKTPALAKNVAAPKAVASRGLLSRLFTGGAAGFGAGVIAPLLGVAAVVGAGYLLYRNMEKKRKSVSAAGGIGADADRAAAAAARKEGKVVPAAVQARLDASGATEADKENAALKAAQLKRDEEAKLRADAARAEGDNRAAERITARNEEQRQIVEKKVAENIAKINAKYGGVKLHKSLVLRGVVTEFFKGRNALVGPLSRYPFTSKEGGSTRQKKKEINQSFGDMMKWAVDLKNSGKSLTLGVLDSFGIIPQASGKLRSTETQSGKYKTKADLMSAFDKEDGIAEWARGTTGSSVPTTSTEMRHKIQQRLEQINIERAKLSMLDQSAITKQNQQGESGGTSPASPNVVVSQNNSNSQATYPISPTGRDADLVRAVEGGYST